MAPLLALALVACGDKPAETSTENPAAAVSKIDIISPAEGAMLNAKVENKLDYNITLGGDGDHAHLYVDNRRIDMLRQMKGSYSFDYLEQGKREICISVVNNGHSSIGVQRCVTVMVE
jgi:hypothetical protein